MQCFSIIAMTLILVACGDREGRSLDRHVELFCGDLVSALGSAADRCSSRDESGESNILGDMSFDARVNSFLLLDHQIALCVRVRSMPQEKQLDVSSQLAILGQRLKETENREVRCQRLRDIAMIVAELSSLPLAR
jgi:hypothetical protein